MSSLFSRTPPTPITTLQKISTSQLRPGMFLVRILDSWWKSPFFIHRRLLKSSHDVQQLMSSGIREVEIDTSLGVGVVSESGMPVDEDLLPEREDEQSIILDEPLALLGAERLSPSQQPVVDPDSGSQLEALQNREEVVQLRDAAVAAVEEAFEGVKTGQPIPQPSIHAQAQQLLQKALANPVLLAETLLIDSLKRFEKTLYAHVVDTAVFSILVGLQLKWDEDELVEIAVAALLHDVGYMRLPQNIVKAQWERGRHSALLKQHVVIGKALIQRQAQFGSNIEKMVGEHHAHQDGSGYPKGHSSSNLLKGSQLLGIMDTFDEFITMGGPSGALPAALAIRRLYQDAQKGVFPPLYIEAMIRALGVFPVGTVVQLSTGEEAFVVQQHAAMSMKPLVKIFRGTDGKILDEPEVCDLAQEANQEHDVNIVKVLGSTEYSIDLQEYF